MASSEVLQPTSGNTSQDSRDSRGSAGGQKSMLELLSITDAAVKALNKSTRSLSSTASSAASRRTDPAATADHSGQLHSSVHSDHSAKSRSNDHSVKSRSSDHSVKSRSSDHSMNNRHSDHSAHESHHSRQSGTKQQDNSYDSGVISKTHTTSDEKSRPVSMLPADGSLHERSSDESTTASDILIRSTLVEKTERSVNGNNIITDNASITSKCSKTSFGVENFNSSGPQKVKISRKRLKEIKPPFSDDQSPRESTSSSSSDGKVPSSLLGISGSRNRRNGSKDSRESSDGGRPAERKVLSRETTLIGNGNSKHGIQSFPRGVDNDQFTIEKVRKSVEKSDTDVNMSSKPWPQTQAPAKIGPGVNLSQAAQPGVKHSRPQQNAPETSTQNGTMMDSDPAHGVNVNNNCGGTNKPTKQAWDATKSSGFTSECVSHPKGTSKYFVERHTPPRGQQTREDPEARAGVPGRTRVEIPERKNLLHDLEESVEIQTVGMHVVADSSGSSSQPEILTVPERIVNVTAVSPATPSSSTSDPDVMTTPIPAPTVSYHSVGFRLRDDNGKVGVEQGGSPAIPPALTRHQLDGEAGDMKTDRPIPAHVQWFNKQVNGHGLQQGAPVVGTGAPDRPPTDDVQITQFRLNDRQRMVKESFAKRQGGPVRRIVQPKIVGHDSKASSTSSTGEQKVAPPGQTSSEVLTVAAAASAAVAATQPFLQAQHEMEARMAAILEKVSALQEGGRHPPPQDRDTERVAELERQISALTERRIEYMETLQAQQMDMQVKLLSMTRDIPGSRPNPRSPELHRWHDTSTPSAMHNKRAAFSKTTVPKPSLKGSYSDKLHKYNVADPDDSTSPLDTPAPRSRAPKPTIYDTSDIEFRNKPRSRSRSPAKQEHDRGILHQILASASPPVRDTSHLRAPPIQTRPVDYHCGQSPNVKKARDLVQDLSHISDQVKGLVTLPAADESVATVASVVGPSPLDPYLMIPDHAGLSPYKPVAPGPARQANAPVLAGFKEAAGVLERVQQNRGYLEANLDSVMRARHDVNVYSLLDNMYHDSSSKEQAHIKSMVDTRIEKLQREVQKEVTDDVVLAELMKNQSTSVPGAIKVPAPAPTAKPTTRYALRNRLAEPKVEPKKVVGKRPGVGKDVSKVKPRPAAKKARSMFEDEEYMARIYGKAGYQRGRTTVKDPYMHFQNAPKQRAARPQGVVKCKGTEMMSSKTQTGGVKQFYFNPSTGMYIPVANVDTAVPGHLIPMAVPLGGPRIDKGLSVSRSPKRDHVTFGAKQVAQVTADGNVALVSMPTDDEAPVKPSPELGRQVLPAVDIDTDVSDISDLKDLDVAHIPAPKSVPPPRPQRAKRTVQISSPEKTPARSPTKAHYEVVYHEDSDSTAAKSETRNGESSITISHSPYTATQVPAARDEEDYSFTDDDADVESATGLQLPGHQPTEPDLAYHGPVFPPKQPSTDRQLTSDLIAEDIRRRDILQNNAVAWLEQELMARILTEVYPRDDEVPPADLSHIFSQGSEDSVAEDNEQSMFVMDSIGRHGLQLFIDAGCAVDNALVQELVRDVLGDKVRGMLAERADQDAAGPYPQTDGATTILQQHGQLEESEEEEPPVRETYVRTPEPTPRVSPASSPRNRLSPVATPRMSPPPASPRLPASTQEVLEQRYVPPPPASEPESEVESSASYDIVEELTRLTAKLRTDVASSVESQHDVQTPPDSPKPAPPMEVYQLPTPPAPSPRHTLKAPTLEPVVVSPKSPVREPTPSPPPEVEEEDEEDQPLPVSDDETDSYRLNVVFTIAETQTDPEPRLTSPSPAPRSAALSQSESSYSESSSISDTFNECVSEGQWLINKSDGEVADFPIDDAAVRQNMYQKSQKKVDISSASTWKDIDDVDLEDMTDLSRSEGEFLYKTPLAPEQDPVLDLLARLQTSSHQYGQYPMSQRQVATVLDKSGKSVGEVLQYTGKSEGEVVQVASRPSEPRRSTKDSGRQPSPHRSKSPPHRSKSPPHRSKSPPLRSKSPVLRVKSPNRVSFEGDRRSGSPTRGILRQFSEGRPAREEELDLPVRDTAGRSQTSAGRLTAGGRQSQGRGQGLMAGGRTSPVKSSMKKPPQVLKSATLPDSRSKPKHGGLRGSADDMRDSRDSTENMAGPSYYSSEFGTHTMTPDQMNTDAFIQSGYLSQSFSQSEGTRQPYDARHSLGGSSLLSSGDIGESRLSASGRSLGLSYGTDSSLGESELHQMAGGTGTLRMLVTIPGTGGFDDDASELSDIDITDGGNTK